MKYSSNFEKYWEDNKQFFEQNSITKEAAYVIWHAAVNDTAMFLMNKAIKGEL